MAQWKVDQCWTGHDKKFNQVSGLQDVGKSDTYLWRRAWKIRTDTEHTWYTLDLWQMLTPSRMRWKYVTCTGDIKRCCSSSKFFSDKHISNISWCPTSWQVRLWPVLISICIYTLSSGKDPTKLEYNQLQFCEHFLSKEGGYYSISPHCCHEESPRTIFLKIHRLLSTPSS